jgi:Na+-transporting NADH:ubiquinone oxidoreductase subunit NqrC
MNNKIYEIGGRKFRFAISLEQDEILAPIVLELFKDCPDVIASVGGSMMSAQTEKSAEKKQGILLSAAVNMVQMNAWIYAKRYARRIMAVLLIEEGKEFAEADLDEKMKFFGKQDIRNVAKELVDIFFMRSGAFGASTPQSTENQKTM